MQKKNKKSVTNNIIILFISKLKGIILGQYYVSGLGEVFENARVEFNGLLVRVNLLVESLAALSMKAVPLERILLYLCADVAPRQFPVAKG